MHALKRRGLENAPFLVYVGPSGETYLLKDRHTGSSAMYSKNMDPDTYVLINGIRSVLGIDYEAERTHILISFMAEIMEDITGKPVNDNYTVGVLTAFINIDNTVYGEIIMHKRDSQAVFRIGAHERSTFISNRLEKKDVEALTSILTELLTIERK